MSTIVDTIRSEIKNWWWFLVMGLLSLATGIAIFARLGEGYVGLSILFSIVMVCTGLSQVFFALSVNRIMRGWGWTLVSGILDLAIGTYLLMYPVVTMATLPYFVGFYLVFRGFYLMGTSMDLNSFGVPNWGWVLTGGLLLLALGFLTMYYPAAGAIGIVAASGSAFIVNGLFSIVLAFQLKRFKREIDESKPVIGTINTPRGEYLHAH
jgi:uncharacterized membrane protein HdeD (DUF308 family)